MKPLSLLSNVVPHITLSNNQWIKSDIYEHPIIRVTIALDGDWCRYTTPPTATNVRAITDTGAQTNVWSLRDFLETSFERIVFIPAPDVIVANLSGIKIAGAFFGTIQGHDADGSLLSVMP